MTQAPTKSGLHPRTELRIVEPAPLVPPAARRYRVLLAEDDVEMRRLLAAGLGHDGYEVIEAADGAALLELIRSAAPDELPDLVVSDNRMPGARGLDILAELHAKRPAIPKILITAFPDEDTRAAAARLGIRIIDKPFALGVLSAAAGDLLPPRGSRNR